MAMSFENATVIKALNKKSKKIDRKYLVEFKNHKILYIMK